MAATTLWQNPLSRRPRSRTTRWTTSFVDNFHIDPPLVVKDTPKPRRLASLGEARAYVDEALRLGRPEAWREVYDRLRAVAGEEDALEAIGDLRELLELEDLLILPVLPLEQATARRAERSGVPCGEGPCPRRSRRAVRMELLPRLQTKPALAPRRRFRYIAADREMAVARVKMIKPEEADAETRKVYDGVVEQWGRISNFSQVLAHQPAALAGWMLPNESIRLNNVKTDPDYVKIQQLVIIKTSALNQSAYCMSHNVPLGKKLGLTEAQIKAAQGSDYMSSPDLDERQKAAIRWADVVTQMQARDDDAAFAAMKDHFSEKQIVELTVFCGMWNYSNRLCEALHVDLERPDKRIEFQQK